MSIDARLTSALEPLGAEKDLASGRFGWQWKSPGVDIRGTTVPWQYLAKRIIDFVGSAIALVLLMPVMVVIGVLIRLDSKGHALFLQQRPGLDGRVFRIWKFRTMVVDAEARLAELRKDGQVLFKMKRDPRITRVGDFLRKTSLDELPQLINVLRGEMSLIGPRPLPVHESDTIRDTDPEAYYLRSAMLPGLSGPWQVNGRSELSCEEMLELERDYLVNWTLNRDLEILFKTVWVLMLRQGAY